MKKRFMSMFIAVLMVFSILPFSAGAVLAAPDDAYFMLSIMDFEEEIPLDAEYKVDSSIMLPEKDEEILGVICRGYFEEANYQTEVDVTGVIPEHLRGQTIYMKTEIPAGQGADVYVQGVAVTEDNRTDILGDQSASYDSENRILTLNNANLTSEPVAADEDDMFQAGVFISSPAPVTIKLEGENTITLGALKAMIQTGIFAGEMPLTIEGEGSLTINAERVEGEDFPLGRGAIRSQGGETIKADIDIKLNDSKDVAIDSGRGSTVFDGAKVTIKNTSTEVGANANWGISSDKNEILVKGDSEIKVETPLGITSQSTLALDVKAGSVLELVCAGQALKNPVTLSATAQKLGVKTKSAADAEYAMWDGETPLNTADVKCILIPGNETQHVATKEATCGAAGNTEYWSVAAADATEYYTDEVLETTTTLDATVIPATGNHTWNDGVVTKEPTATETGVKTFTCTVCGETKTEEIPATGYGPGDDPDQMGDDGTPVGPGASETAADKAISSMASEDDPAGSQYLPLKLKSTKQTKTSVKISWKKQTKAVKYVIYGNKCGKNVKMKKLATVTGSSKNFKKVAGKKVKKGTPYKFLVVALDKNNNVVSTSKMIHAFTKGGKRTNHKSVKVQLKSGKKYKAAKKATVKAGKKVKIRGVGVKKDKKLKYKAHVKMRYASSNPKVATVSAKGVIKGVKKGSCTVYAYSQNGVAKTIKVTVK